MRLVSALIIVERFAATVRILLIRQLSFAQSGGVLMLACAQVSARPQIRHGPTDDHLAVLLRPSAKSRFGLKARNQKVQHLHSGPAGNDILSKRCHNVWVFTRATVLCRFVSKAAGPSLRPPPSLRKQFRRCCLDDTRCCLGLVL